MPDHDGLSRAGSRTLLSGALSLLVFACAQSNDLRLDGVEPASIAWLPALAPVELHGVFEPGMAVDLGSSGSTPVQASEAFAVMFVDAGGNSLPAAAVRFVSDTLIEATPPPLLQPGSYDVTVVGPDGRRSTKKGAL